jgi:uncharacterized protein (TIGR03086 family)
MTTKTISPTDPRSVFAHAVATAGATIAAVQPGQLTAATPCDEYDVRTLIGHMVAVLDRVTLMGEGSDPMASPRLVTGVDDDGWHAAWTNAAHRVQAAWTDDAALDRTVVLPWAQAPGADMLAMYSSELSVHTWDLARATGQQPQWNEQVLEIALVASGGLPDGDRAAAFEQMRPNLPPEIAAGGPPFGNPIAADAEAPLIDKLVAWYGRRP